MGKKSPKHWFQTHLKTPAMCKRSKQSEKHAKRVWYHLTETLKKTVKNTKKKKNNNLQVNFLQPFPFQRTQTQTVSQSLFAAFPPQIPDQSIYSFKKRWNHLIASVPAVLPSVRSLALFHVSVSEEGQGHCNTSGRPPSITVLHNRPTCLWHLNIDSPLLLQQLKVSHRSTVPQKKTEKKKKKRLI